MQPNAMLALRLRVNKREEERYYYVSFKKH